MYECRRCTFDVSSFVSWSTCGDDFECPSCKHKMVVTVVSYYDGEEEDESLAIESAEPV